MAYQSLIVPVAPPVTWPGSLRFIILDDAEFPQGFGHIVLGAPIEVRVSDPTAPLADRLPITVEVRVNGVVQQTVVIDGDPPNVCATNFTCSAYMDAIDWVPGDVVEVTATDANGNVVAYQIARTRPL